MSHHKRSINPYEEALQVDAEVLVDDFRASVDYLVEQFGVDKEAVASELLTAFNELVKEEED